MTLRAWVEFAGSRRRQKDVAETNQHRRFETLKKWYGEAVARKRMGL